MASHSPEPMRRKTRLNILHCRGIKITHPEYKESTIFGSNAPKLNKEEQQLAKELCEARIDQQLKSVSPYIGGQRNENFISSTFNHEEVYMKKTPANKNKKFNTNSRNEGKINVLGQKVQEKVFVQTASNFNSNQDSFFGNKNQKPKVKDYSYDLNSWIIKTEEKERKRKDLIEKNALTNVEEEENQAPIKTSRLEKLKEREKETVENPFKFKEELDKIKKEKIETEIKKREEISNISSLSIVDERESNKKRLQKQNENETFHIHDQDKSNHEILRAKEKHKQKEIIQSKYLNKMALSSKMDVDEYYSKCVDNYKYEEEKGEEPKNENYMKELEEQIEKNKIKETAKKIKNTKEENNFGPGQIEKQKGKKKFFDGQEKTRDLSNIDKKTIKLENEWRTKESEEFNQKKISKRESLIKEIKKKNPILKSNKK